MSLVEIFFLGIYVFLVYFFGIPGLILFMGDQHDWKDKLIVSITALVLPIAFPFILAGMLSIWLLKAVGLIIMTLLMGLIYIGYWIYEHLPKESLLARLFRKFKWIYEKEVYYIGLFTKANGEIHAK